MAIRKVSNELWAALEPLIPEFVPSRKGGRRRSVDDQAALNGILYVLHTGIPWERRTAGTGLWQRDDLLAKAARLASRWRLGQISPGDAD